MVCSHGPGSAQNKAEQTCICPLCVDTHFPLDRITTFKTYYIIILCPFKFCTFHNTYKLRIRNFRSNMKHGPRFPDKEPFLFEMSSCFLGFCKMQNYLLHVQSWWICLGYERQAARLQHIVTRKHNKLLQILLL